MKGHIYYFSGILSSYNGHDGSLAMQCDAWVGRFSMLALELANNIDPMCVLCVRRSQQVIIYMYMVNVEHDIK